MSAKTERRFVEALTNLKNIGVTDVTLFDVIRTKDALHPPKTWIGRRLLSNGFVSPLDSAKYSAAAAKLQDKGTITSEVKADPTRTTLLRRRVFSLSTPRA